VEGRGRDVPCNYNVRFCHVNTNKPNYYSYATFRVTIIIRFISIRVTKAHMHTIKVHETLQFKCENYERSMQ